MSSVKAQLLDSFKTSKEYRHAFVEEKVQTQLAIQMKVIREERNISRPEFAALMGGKAPSWVFRLEDPNQSPPTIRTLLEVAKAFDVDLEISFRPFSHLLNRIERLTPESFEVPSFEEEVTEGAFEKAFTLEEARLLLESLRNKNIGNPVTIERDAQPLGVTKMFVMPAPSVRNGHKISVRRRSPRLRRRAA